MTSKFDGVKTRLLLMSINLISNSPISNHFNYFFLHSIDVYNHDDIFVYLGVIFLFDTAMLIFQFFFRDFVFFVFWYHIWLTGYQILQISYFLSCASDPTIWFWGVSDNCSFDLVMCVYIVTSGPDCSNIISLTPKYSWRCRILNLIACTYVHQSNALLVKTISLILLIERTNYNLFRMLFGSIFIYTS